jgi:hypothetical protein
MRIILLLCLVLVACSSDNTENEAGERAAKSVTYLCENFDIEFFHKVVLTKNTLTFFVDTDFMQEGAAFDSKKKLSAKLDQQAVPDIPNVYRVDLDEWTERFFEPDANMLAGEKQGKLKSTHISNLGGDDAETAYLCARL